jgi:hypothetical protein
MTTESGADAIADWANAIDNNTTEAYLKSLRIGELDDSDSVALLSELILTLYDKDNYDDSLLNGVLDVFDPIRPSFSRGSPFSTVMIVLPLISLSAVSWVYMRQSVDITTIILNGINWMGNEEVALVMDKAVRIFLRRDKTTPYDILNNPASAGTLSALLPVSRIGFLMDEAEKKGNDGMWNWLREAYAENGPLVGAGPWMLKESSIDHKIPLKRATLIGKPISDNITTLLQKRTPDSSFLRVLSIAEGDASLTSAKTKLIAYESIDDRYSNEEEEIELFRLYGPSNPFYVDKEDELEDYEPGDDRMLTCQIFNWDDDIEGFQPIFSGTCDWKGHTISSERAAVRRPVPHGGWEGSYCSFACIREQLEDMRSTEEIQGIEWMEAALDTMEEMMLRWGMYADKTTTDNVTEQARR